MSHASTKDVSHTSLAAVFRPLKMVFASLKIGSSRDVPDSRHVVTLCKGVGLGAGVGGEAGAEGKTGFMMVCGSDGCITVLGVRGGLG